MAYRSKGQRKDKEMKSQTKCARCGKVLTDKEILCDDGPNAIIGIECKGLTHLEFESVEADMELRRQMALPENYGDGAK